MKKGLALLSLVLLVVAGPARAVSYLPSWNDAQQKAWWAKNLTPDLWPKAADALQAQLEATYKQNGARAFSDTDFQEWFEHLEWIRLGLACPDAIQRPADLGTFVSLGQDESISHLLVEKLSPLDDKCAALQNILTLAEANQADLHEYAALGVAFSVVFDVPFPDDWPHSQVEKSAVPIGDVDIVKRFQFYVQSNRDHKLDLDPTRLSFESLKYLVDSEVKLSELAYAQSNRISNSEFANAFFSIKYDEARIASTNNQYVWGYPSYQLLDIEKDGGICIDQAYYAETLGKGRGIPTIRFTGYGLDSAHAWFGYLSKSGKWELDCGRYEQQNYPKGFAVDPQTWQPIDDSVLQYLFKNGAKDPNFQPAMTALAWAHLHENTPAYAKILDDAKSIMPEWTGTWRLQARFVDKSGDVEKEKQFYQDWIDQLSKYTDLKVEGQKRLYHDLKAAHDPDADTVLKDIIVQNRSEGFDLGVSAAQDALNDKLKAQDWDGAKSVFERAVRDFGDSGGLTLFKDIVYPFIKTCLQNNKLDYAERAIRFTEDRMKIEPTSQVGQAFARLKDDVADKKSGN